jgi:Ca2+-binding RTX toxin-like protein
LAASYQTVVVEGTTLDDDIEATITYVPESDTFNIELQVNGNAGDDTLIALGPMPMLVNGEYSLDIGTRLYGGDGNDALIGKNRGDTFFGDDGNDALGGMAGNDYLEGGAGNDYLDGWIDDDLLYGQAGTDTLYGDQGNDTLFAGDSGYADVMYGGFENDTIHVGGGALLVDGDEGTDTVFGSGDLSSTGFYDVETFVAVTPGATLRSETVNEFGSVVVGANIGLHLANAGTIGSNFSAAGTLGYVQGSSFADTIDLGTQTVAWRIESGDTVGGNVLFGGAANDFLLSTSTAAGDTLFGGDGGDDTLNGAGGNDSLLGGSGNDLLYGAGGNDVLFGGLGDDVLIGGGGGAADNVDAGAGNDTITASAGAVTVDGGFGTDTLFGGGDMTSTGIAGVEVFILDSNAGVTLSAAQINAFSSVQFLGNNGLYMASAGTVGTNFGTGAGGLVRSSSGADTVDLSAQTLAWRIESGDTVGGNLLIGGAGNDVVISTSASAADTLSGNAGNDTLTGAAGNDSVSGGDGNDRISGGLGGDSISGGAGDDSLSGDGGDDRMDGGTGNDSLHGGGGLGDLLDFSGSSAGVTVDMFFSTAVGAASGADSVVSFERVLGSDFADKLTGGGADIETLDGGAGSDTIDYSFYSSALNIQLHTSLADATLEGGFDFFLSIENAVGGSAADQIWGNDVDNVLVGNGDDDWLHGFGSSDTLYGGTGNDQVLGGGAADTLYGGNGNDFFWFDNQDALFGGAGTDYAYNTDATGVTVNLGTSSLEGVWANNGVDVLNASSATWSVQLIGYGSGDTLRGGSAGDYIWFDELDTVTGGGGIDAAYAATNNGVTVNYSSQGIEQVWATTGNDLLDASGMSINGVYLIAYSGTDTALGGSGNDYMWVDWDATDVISGGTGRDEMYQIGSGAVSMDLGTAGIEAVLGSNQADVLNGASQAQWLLLIGQAGTDTLIGGTDNDYLYGGDDADRITGGAGNDFMFGGAGADTFVNTSVSGGSGTDQFYDFATGDRILVSGNNVISGIGSSTAVLTDGSTLVTNNGYNWQAGDFI